MDKILAALAEMKSYFTGIKSALDKLTASEERNKQLEAELATARAAIASSNGEWEVKITNLNKDLQKAQDEVNAKGTEIKNLQAQLEAAQAETNKVKGLIAAQGIPLDELPAADTKSNPGAKEEIKGTLTQQCIAANKKRTGK